MLFSLRMAKKKFKPVLPSLREKKRYIAFEIISDNKVFEFEDVNKAIIDGSYDFLGVLGMSKAGLMIMRDKWNFERSRGLVKINHKNIDNFKAALTMVKTINENKVILRSLGVAGTLKKATNKYLGYAG